MKVYIIKVTPEAATSKISQEGYTIFDEAKAFVESRTPTPIPCSPYIWRDEDYTEYEIVEVAIPDKLKEKK